MKQFVAKHRKYQVLKWIEALEDGYPGDGIYPPMISNLSLFMVEAGVREKALKARFGRGAFRGSYNKDMLNGMKSYLLNLMSKYQRYIFNEREIRKTKRWSYALEKGIESRSGFMVTAYFLSSRGKRELDDLHRMTRRRHELTPRNYPRDLVDKLILPKKKGRRWHTVEIALGRDLDR